MKSHNPEIDPIAAAVESGVTPRVTPAQIEWIIAFAIRCPAVSMCATGSDGITSRMFDRSEAPFVLVWKAGIEVLKENNGALPANSQAARDLFVLALSAEAAKDPGYTYYTREIRSSVLDPGGMLDRIFGYVIDDVTQNKAFELLGKFLIERSMSDPIRDALLGISTGESLTNPMAVFEAVERRTRAVEGLKNDPGQLLVTGDIDNWMPKGRHTNKTGRQFMDNLLGGGYAPREAYAVSAATSAGKSCLVVNLIIDACEQEAAAAAESGNLSDVGYWYFFTYELSREQLDSRMHAYGARIHFHSFKGQLSTATDPSTIKDYELEPWVNSPGNPVMGELERLKAFRRRVAAAGRLIVVDYSGGEQGHGRGGVNEVKMYLKREASRGRRIAGFVIDYAGIMISRYITHNSLDPRQEYFYLKSLGDDVRNQICVPMNCTAWVLNQLHGDAGRKPSGAKQHHSSVLGCHNFADNFDYGIQFGMYNGESGLVTMHCSKHRSSARTEDGVIAKFDGRFGAFMDPDDDYMVDPMTGQIVRRDFLDQVPVGPSQSIYRPQNRNSRIVNPLDGAN